MANSYLAAGIASGIDQGTKKIDAYDKEQFRRQTMAQEMDQRNQQLDLNRQSTQQNIAASKNQMSIANTQNSRQQYAHQQAIKQVDERDQVIKEMAGRIAQTENAQAGYVMQNSVNNYTQYSGTKYAGEAMTNLNAAISSNPKLKKMFGKIEMPNINNPEHMKQIQQWAMSQQAGDDGQEITPVPQESLDELAMSGQFIVGADGVVKDANDVMIKMGSFQKMPPSSTQKWKATLAYNNAVAMASSGKMATAGAGGTYDQIAGLMAKKDAGTITPAESQNLIALQKEEKTYEATADNWVSTSPQAKGLRNKMTSDEPLNSVEVDTAMEYQEAAKKPNLTTVQRGETYGLVPVLASGTKAYNTIVQNPDAMLKGMEQSKELYAKSRFSDKKFNELTLADQKQVLSTLKLNTELGMVFSTYVKAISGGAVANEEFERIAGDIFGGDLTAINMKALMTSFGAFMNNTRAGIEKSAEGYSRTQIGDAANVIYMTQQIPPLQEIDMSQSGTLDLNPASTATEAAKQGINTAASGVNAVVSAVKDYVNPPAPQPTGKTTPSGLPLLYSN